MPYKSFMYEGLLLEAAADSDYVKQKGSATFLTLVKEESLSQTL